MPQVTGSRSLAEKLRGRSWTELRDRGSQFLATLLERARLLDAREPSDDRFLASLGGIGAVRTPQRWLGHFQSRETPRFFASFDSPAETSAAIVALDASAGRVVRSADAIMAGRFDLLGFRGIEFGMPPDWHVDPLAGVRAPHRHWSRIDYLDPTLIGDHKLVWELNRQHWLVTLGTAYWLTGDERYAKGIIASITSWMDRNPPTIGVNWASSLEVAFRAIAWIWALNLLRRSPVLAPEFFTRVTKHLALHARHLERNLSTWFSPNTHLTGEALGLFYVGLMFPELPGSDRWRAAGASILLERLEEHALPDGVYFEQATHYQRYTVDFYLHFLTLAERNGLEVRAAVAPRLEVLLDHLAFLSRPDGTVPMRGDEDGGRLVFLDERGPADVRSPLATGALIFGRADLAAVAGRPTAELIWLAGPEAPSRLASLGGEPPVSTSRAFPVGGVYVMRDGWKSGSRHLVVDCGPHGAANCGHAHADALALEIWADGGPLLVDPGTFTYTTSRDDRDHFRSTGAHNTLEVDGQSSSVMAGPFQWASMARCETLHWRTFSGADWIEGRHDGYRRLPDPVTHRRGVLFIREGYWVVRDVVEATGAHDIALNFQADPTVAMHARDGGIVDLTRHGTFTARLLVLAPNAHGTMVVEEGWVSPAYGIRSRAPRARFRYRSSGASRVVSMLLPRAAQDAGQPRVPLVRSLPATEGNILEVRDDAFADLVLLDTPGDAQAGIITDAVVAWIRRRTGDGAVISAMFVGGSFLRVAGGVELAGKGAASAWRDHREWRLEGDAVALNAPGLGSTVNQTR